MCVVSSLEASISSAAIECDAERSAAQARSGVRSRMNEAARPAGDLPSAAVA